MREKNIRGPILSEHGVVSAVKERIVSLLDQYICCRLTTKLSKQKL